MGIFDYIRNGLPQITLGEIILWGGAVIGFFKAIETIFGKKYIGTWAWNGLKRFFLLPINIMHKLDSLQVELKFVRDEVQYNGGTVKLRDAVEKIDKNVGQALAQAQDNGVEIAEVKIKLKIREDCDLALIYKLNAAGGCHYCNEAFYKYFGYAEPDVIAFNWENIIKASDLPEVRKRWERAYATRSQFLSKHTIINSDGEEILCKVIGMPLIVGDVLKGFYGTVTPI